MTTQPHGADQARPAIPVLATMFNPHHPVAPPEVFHEGARHRPLENVADTIYFAMREESMERPPTGSLYMEHGAYDLADVFDAMWNAPQSQRLREETDGPVSVPPAKATEQAARDAVNKIWADFLWDHGVTE